MSNSWTTHTNGADCHADCGCNSIEYLRASLALVFTTEWDRLSDADKSLIVRDCIEDGGVSDLGQYRRNIGGGNLASYARTQRVRFANK